MSWPWRPICGPDRRCYAFGVKSSDAQYAADLAECDYALHEMCILAFDHHRPTSNVTGEVLWECKRPKDADGVLRYPAAECRAYHWNIEREWGMQCTVPTMECPGTFLHAKDAEGHPLVRLTVEQPDGTQVAVCPRLTATKMPSKPGRKKAPKRDGIEPKAAHRSREQNRADRWLRAFLLASTDPAAEMYRREDVPTDTTVLFAAIRKAAMREKPWRRK